MKNLVTSRYAKVLLLTIGVAVGVYFLAMWFVAKPSLPMLKDTHGTVTALNGQTPIAELAGVSTTPSTGNGEPVVLLSQCEQHLTQADFDDAWQQHQEQQVTDMLQQAQKSGVSGMILDQVAAQAGIGVQRGRIMIHNYGIENPIYHVGHQTFATNEFHYALQMKFVFGDYDGALKVLKQTRFRAEDILILNGHRTYAFGAFLTAVNRKISAHDQPEKFHAIIQALLDQGLLATDIDIQYADLLLATQLHLSTEILDQLVNDSRQDPSAILTHNGIHSSLLLLALQAHHAEAALFWLKRGSPVAPDIFLLNAFDVLAANWQDFSDDERNGLFSAIAQTGLSSAKPQSLEILQQHIAAPLLGQYPLTMQGPLLSDHEQIQVQALIAQLYQQMLLGHVDFTPEQLPQHACFNPLGHYLTVKATENMPVDVDEAVRIAQQRKQAQADPVAAAKAEVQTKAQTDAKIADLINKATQANAERSAIEAALGESQSYLNKQALAQYRKQIAFSFMADLTKEINNDDARKASHESLMKAMALAQAGKWSEAIAIIEQLDDDNVSSLSSLLVVAISADVDFAIIKDLLARGAQLQPMALTFLISKNNVNLAKQLLPYGLVIDYRNEFTSGLAMAVTYKAFDMLKFLIAQGVAMDSDMLGYDALDIALQQYDYRTSKFIYIDALIHAGATIELSHQQIVAELRNTDLEGYMRTVTRHPGLKLD